MTAVSDNRQVPERRQASESRGMSEIRAVPVAQGKRPEPPPMRASDAERYATVEVLQDAIARGLLTLDEGSDRMEAAFAARYRRDLGPLTADLPAPPKPHLAPPGWRPLAGMAVEQLRATVRGDGVDRMRPVRVAVALLLAFLLMVAVGSLAVHLMIDQGAGFGGGGPGFQGFRGGFGPH